MTDLAELQKLAHENARNKGFHDTADRLKALVMNLRETDSELAELILSSYYSNRLMLIVGELSEAHEEIRRGRAMNEQYEVDGKPEGVPSELADVGIRLLDLQGEIEVELETTMGNKMGFNSTRPHLHGGKKF